MVKSSDWGPIWVYVIIPAMIMGLLFESLKLDNPLRGAINFSDDYGRSEYRLKLDPVPVSRTVANRFVQLLISHGWNNLYIFI